MKTRRFPSRCRKSLKETSVRRGQASAAIRSIAYAEVLAFEPRKSLHLARVRAGADRALRVHEPPPWPHRQGGRIENSPCSRRSPLDLPSVGRQRASGRDWSVPRRCMAGRPHTVVALSENLSDASPNDHAYRATPRRWALSRDRGGSGAEAAFDGEPPRPRPASARPDGWSWRQGGAQSSKPDRRLSDRPPPRANQHRRARLRHHEPFQEGREGVHSYVSSRHENRLGHDRCGCRLDPLLRLKLHDCAPRSDLRWLAA